MKVYIELLFLDNLVLNFIILYFSGRFARIPLRFAREMAAAAVGGAYACLMFAVQGIFILCSGKNIGFFFDVFDCVLQKEANKNLFKDGYIFFCQYVGDGRCSLCVSKFIFAEIFY